MFNRKIKRFYQRAIKFELSHLFGFNLRSNRCYGVDWKFFTSSKNCRKRGKNVMEPVFVISWNWSSYFTVCRNVCWGIYMYGQRQQCRTFRSTPGGENKFPTAVDPWTYDRVCIWPDIGHCSLIMYAAYKGEVGTLTLLLCSSVKYACKKKQSY